MPVYKERQIGKYMATVKPSGFKQGLIKRAPFFNGSYVCFDLRLKSKAEKIEKDSISIDWELWDKSEY